MMLTNTKSYSYFFSLQIYRILQGPEQVDSREDADEVFGFVQDGSGSEIFIEIFSPKRRLYTRNEGNHKY